MSKTYAHLNLSSCLIIVLGMLDHNADHFDLLIWLTMVDEDSQNAMQN